MAKRQTAVAGGRRSAVNTKITDELRDKLEASAEASGRTLSGEIEYRLGLTYRDDLVGETPTAFALRAAGFAFRTMELASGRRWNDDQTTARLACDLAIRVIKQFMLPNELPPSNLASHPNKLMRYAGEARDEPSKLDELAYAILKQAADQYRADLVPGALTNRSKMEDR